MRARPLVLGAAAAGLLAAGLWLGHASSAASEPVASEAAPRAPRSAPTAPVAGPVMRAPATTPAPTLARRTASPDRALAADLADPDPKVRRAAVREVAADPAADPATLLAASRDPDLEVGVVATARLGKLHEAGELPAAELIARARDRSLDPRVRLTALDALGVVPSPEAAAFLADLLSGGDTFDRTNAAILIAHQDLEIAVPALIRALGDAEPQVRSNAVDALRLRARGRDFGSDAAAWQAWWQARAR